MGGTDEVFQRTDTAGTRNFLTNAIGSTLALTDSTGSVQTSYSFDAYGNTSSSGAPTTSSFAYTGRELDATGLYSYRARYYNPVLQRFISEDPSGLDGGDLNLYRYVKDEPIDSIDPFGLKSQCTLFGGCSTIPFGPKPLSSFQRPSSAGAELVRQDLAAYRNCVAQGTRGIQNSELPKPDRTTQLLGEMAEATNEANRPLPMPGDPEGPDAFPDTGNPTGPSDGLEVLNDLAGRYNDYKRGKVADACAASHPIAQLSPYF
jgi:RHS repeat-associated protein